MPGGWSPSLRWSGRTLAPRGRILLDRRWRCMLQRLVVVGMGAVCCWSVAGECWICFHGCSGLCRQKRTYRLTVLAPPIPSMASPNPARLDGPLHLLQLDAGQSVVDIVIPNRYLEEGTDRARKVVLGKQLLSGLEGGDIPAAALRLKWRPASDAVHHGLFRPAILGDTRHGLASLPFQSLGGYHV